MCEMFRPKGFALNTNDNFLFGILAVIHEMLMKATKGETF